MRGVYEIEMRLSNFITYGTHRVINGHQCRITTTHTHAKLESITNSLTSLREAHSELLSNTHVKN